MSVFFILGAGASRDSGLNTYRGPEGHYKGREDMIETLHSMNNTLEKIWETLSPLYQKIRENSPGKTYELIKEIGKKYPDSFILNQNIDGYAESTGLPVIEMHGNWKTMTCLKCKESKESDPENFLCSCGEGCRPDIVLFGENLPRNKVQQTYNYIKNHPQYVIIIGTTLQFPYLRTFITKAKQKGALIVHINPDPKYEPNVRKREFWFDVPSAEGLEKFLEW